MANLFSRFSSRVATASGRPLTFVIALVFILVWGVSGPFFGFSETWQLVVNTATTIVTFLMVFVLQNSQNRDGEAIHAKLDELILASAAENQFIEAERLTDREIRHLRAMIEEARDALIDEWPAEAAGDTTRKPIHPGATIPGPECAPDKSSGGR